MHIDVVIVIILIPWHSPILVDQFYAFLIIKIIALIVALNLTLLKINILIVLNTIDSCLHLLFCKSIFYPVSSCLLIILIVYLLLPVIKVNFVNCATAFKEIYKLLKHLFYKVAVSRKALEINYRYIVLNTFMVFSQ